MAEHQPLVAPSAPPPSAPPPSAPPPSAPPVLAAPVIVVCDKFRVNSEVKQFSGDVQRHQRGRGRRGGRAAGPDAEDDGGAGAEADCPARAGRSATTFTLLSL